MSISAIGLAATPMLQPHPKSAPAQSAVATPVVGGDSDGDNDGSKGGTVDVRA